MESETEKIIETKRVVPNAINELRQIMFCFLVATYLSLYEFKIYIFLNITIISFKEFQHHDGILEQKKCIAYFVHV